MKFVELRDVKCLTTYSFSLMDRLVVVVTSPLPRDGGMAEHHGVSEAGKLPRAWTKSRTETENRQRASGAKSPQLDNAK